MPKQSSATETDTSSNFSDTLSTALRCCLFLREQSGSKTRFEYVAPQFGRIFGIEAAAIQQAEAAFFDALEGNDAKRVADAFARARETGELSIEARLRGADGRVRWIDVSATYRQELDGRRVWEGLIADVSERRNAQEELTQLQTLLQRVLDTTLEGVMVLLAIRGAQSEIVDFRWLMVNPAAERMLGATQSSLAGQKMSDVLGDAAKKTFEAYRSVIESGRPYQQEAWYVDGDQKIWFRSTAVRLGDGIAVTFSDISRSKQVEDDLRRSKEDAERASRFKSAFLANVSHEIRTPMNSIIGFTEILLESNLDNQQRSYAQRVFQSGQNLLALINDLLDVSKIEAGQLTLEETEFDLVSLIIQTFDDVRRKDRSQTVNLIWEGWDIPRRLTGDPTRVRQIIMNLLSNAVKFTERGEVRLRTVWDMPKAMLTIEVSDTGIGIPFDRHEDIFQSFVQGDGATSRRFGGTGLGLSICRDLCRMMGGEIDVQSKPGQGSVFRVNIRLKERAKTTVAEVWREKGRNAIILEADPSLAELAALCVQHMGMSPLVVHSLEELVAQVAQQEFFLIVIDGVRYPTAFEDCVRASEVNRFATPCIARLVNYGDLKPGVLLRPLNPWSVRRFLRAANAIIPTTTNVTVRRNAMTILVADDDESNRELMRLMLESIGHTVVLASDGQEALDIMRERDLDAVFMDMRMPHLSGPDASQTARNEGIVCTVIGLTANTSAEDVEMCLASGMVDALSKPISKARLIDALRTHCKISASPGRILKRLKHGTRSSSEDEDTVAVARRIGVDVHDLVSLRRNFLESAIGEVSDFRKYVEALDLDALRRTFHRVRGTSANLGLKEIAHLAKILEDKGSSADQRREALLALEAELHEQAARIVIEDDH